MEKQIAEMFREKVEELLIHQDERQAVYSILKKYHSKHNVSSLVEDLKIVLCEPRLLELYDAIRPLIPVKQQIEYDQKIPTRPSDKIRLVKLLKRPNQGMGFAVRGGLEHGVGLYISQVVANSQASEAGLRVGDEIIRLNGYSIAQAIHQEVLQFIKSKKEFELRVRYVGMLPIRENPEDKLSWKHVQEHNSSHSEDDITSNSEEIRDVKLSINLPVGASLGCSICSGPENVPGIFIQSVKVGGIAQEAGLEVGDQMIDVNGTAFFNITHSQAIVALKGSRMLNITVRKRAGYVVFGVRGTPITEEEQKLLQQEKINLTLKKQQAVKDTDKNRLFDEDEVRINQPNPEESKMSTDKLNAKPETTTNGKNIKDSAPGITDGSRPEFNEPLYIQTAQTSSTKHKVSPKVPTYITDKENPSFRIQKPVLLHPTRRPSEIPNPLKEHSEVEYPDGGFTRDNFMPTRLFTNEEIAGRQIKLLNLMKHKDSACNLGLELELTESHYGHHAVLVKSVNQTGELYRQGGVHKGDEVLMVDQHRMIGRSLEHASVLLEKVYTHAKDSLQLIIAKALPSDMITEITYF